MKKKIRVISLIIIALISTLCFSNVKAAVKGDLRLNEIADRVEVVTGHYKNQNEGYKNPGDIEIRKIVEKTNVLGRYKVTFGIKGIPVEIKEEIDKPVYAVVVFDRSNSMNNSNKWTQAVNGAITFSTELKKNIPQAQMALVVFSGTINDESWNNKYNDAKLARGFSNSPFVTNDFGNPGGGTNLGEGIRRAGIVLESAPSDAYKYIVVMGDGEPTYYTNGNGNTAGPGDSMNDNTRQYAYSEANKLKNKGIEIFSIGYSVATNSTAETVLKTVSSQNLDTNTIKHYYNANPTEVAKAFKSVAETISRADAGTSAILTDNLGEKFTLTNGSSTTREVVFNIGDITEIEKFTEPFYIDIDPNSPTGWYDTNDGFTLTYIDPITKQQATPITCDQNPEAYWYQPLINIVVNKQWDDLNNLDNLRPEKVVVRLFGNDKNQAIDSVELSSENNWTTTFENLYEYRNGSRVDYTVVEDSVSGYITQYTPGANNSITITNIQTTKINVTKNWVNADMFMTNGKLPGIIVKLSYKENQSGTWHELEAVTLPGTDNKWEYTWDSTDELPLLRKYTYKVEEIGFSGIQDKSYADYIFENFFKVSVGDVVIDEEGNNNFAITNNCIATFELPETGSHMGLIMSILFLISVGAPAVYMVYTFTRRYI